MVSPHIDQFVYDPHLAPQVEAWTEALSERRRRARARRQGPIAVPAMSETRAADLARTGDDKKSDGNDAEGPSVELEDLVAKEVAEWKSTGPHGTLRQRKTKGGNVLEEVCIPSVLLVVSHD